jgi:uncharacterized protein
MSTKTVSQYSLPAASLANARTLTVIRYGDNPAGGKAYVQAGLHADEAPGFVVLHHLINLLDRANSAGTIQGQIIIVPVANPIGLGQWRDEVLQGRFDFYNSLNFNRGFPDLTDPIADRIKDRLHDTPAENVALIRQAAAEVLASASPQDETEHLKHLLLGLSHDADIVLDLHCDDQAVVHVYLGTPLWPDAADLSARLEAEATLLAEDSGVTPFDEACSRIWWRLGERFPGHPIPPACLSATVELRGKADVSHESALQDAEHIFGFLQGRGLIRGEAPTLPRLRHEATPLRGVAHIKAPVPGIVVFIKRPGDRVASGETIAEIVNPLSTERENRVTAVKSTIEGLLFSIGTEHFARPGCILAKIAGRTPIKAKGANLLTL